MHDSELALFTSFFRAWGIYYLFILNSSDPGTTVARRKERNEISIEERKPQGMKFG
jgi:hypothetical protein